LKTETGKFLSSKENNRSNFRITFIILSLVGIFIFLAEDRNAAFTPSGLYSGVSVHGITLSKNLLNNDQLFFMFTSKEYQDGKKVYEAYNRFPVFSFLLTGLLTHPFESNPATEVYAARQLMNIFFFLSIIVVFRIVDELAKNKYLALSVSLVTFSSYYMLTYNNMIFNDIPALLGFVVAIYGVISASKKKLQTRHILFYSIFPICLGWQPYAVYVTWFLIDALEIFFKKDTAFRSKFLNIFKQPSFIITGLAVIGGIFILGLQLLNEWRIVGGPFASIPTLKSALWRTGLISSEGYTNLQFAFNWIPFLSGQAHAITMMLIPFFPIFLVEPGTMLPVVLIIVLIVYVLIRYFKDKSLINKVYVIMILSGLFWAVPMRHFVALHDFQSIFYVGFVMTVYILILSNINTKAWKLLAIDISLVFLINVSLSNHYKTQNLAMNRIIPQFQNISDKLPKNSKVYFDGDRKNVVPVCRFAIDFFLGDDWYVPAKDADYIISKNPDYNGVKLTSNREFNLFKAKDKSGELKLQNQ